MTYCYYGLPRLVQIRYSSARRRPQTADDYGLIVSDVHPDPPPPFGWLASCLPAFGETSIWSAPFSTFGIRHASTAHRDRSSARGLRRRGGASDRTRRVAGRRPTWRTCTIATHFNVEVCHMAAQWGQLPRQRFRCRRAAIASRVASRCWLHSPLAGSRDTSRSPIDRSASNSESASRHCPSFWSSVPTL
jgi:hypothetical protein